MEKQRVNIQISKEVHEWYKQRSQEIGTSMSALLAIAVTQYMDQANGMRALGKGEVIGMMEKMYQLVEESKK